MLVTYSLKSGPYFSESASLTLVLDVLISWIHLEKVVWNWDRENWYMELRCFSESKQK